MATIHDEIDNWLAADVHEQLSEEERHALHTHLVECAACRRSHQENKIMNKILEETLASEKADPRFEQRMLSAFRTKVSYRPDIGAFFVKVIRLRPVQITAAVAILLALVQIGRLLTGERILDSRARYASATERTIATGSKVPTAEEAGPSPVDSYRSQDIDRLAANEPQSMADSGTFSDKVSSDEKGKVLQAPAAAPAGSPAGVLSSTHGENKSDIASFVKKSATLESEARAKPAKVEEAEAAPAPSRDSRKLIRNSKVDLEIVNFDETVQKITGFASEEKGYLATSGSQKQANGKLKGQVVVKVLPDNLDRFLQKVRGLGDLKNQTLGTEDVTKAYFDTDSRLKNARVMEQRLIDMLKTKTGKVSDLLQVEKELGRVREDIEKMQGELKYWDSQVQFATVTIALAEKDMEEPAAFLLKERAQLALYSPEVERIYNDIKALASAKTQITNAQLDRDNAERASARISMLIAPEESDAQITRVKAMARVENFQMQTERVAQGGTGMSENAKTKRDKVELNITISQDEQEQSFQQTSLRIRTSSVDDKAKQLRDLAEKQDGRVRSSSFSRDPDGREFANVSLRVPIKNYPALMQSLNPLGKVEHVAVQRQDRTGGLIDEANAPADVSIQIYSQGNIVSHETGLFATLRQTLAQSAAAIMWSLRMIGVAVALLAPWVIALVAVVWVGKRIARARRKL
jgi:hypothetical protein